MASTDSKEIVKKYEAWQELVDKTIPLEIKSAKDLTLNESIDIVFIVNEKGDRIELTWKEWLECKGVLKLKDKSYSLIREAYNLIKSEKNKDKIFILVKITEEEYDLVNTNCHNYWTTAWKNKYQNWIKLNDMRPYPVGDYIRAKEIVENS